MEMETGILREGAGEEDEEVDLWDEGLENVKTRNRTCVREANG